MPAASSRTSTEHVLSAGEPAGKSTDIYPISVIVRVPQQTHSMSRSSFSIVSWVRQRPWSLGLCGWAVVAGFIAVRLLIVFAKIRKKIDSSLPAPGHIELLLGKVAADLNCGRNIAVRYSTAFTSPFLAGVRRPVIILPERMLHSEYHEELPAVFAHEVAHLRSRDLVWMAAARWLSVLLWFHPLIWKVLSAHSSACEEVCDSVAADYIGNAESYSSTLARVALAIVAKVPADGGHPNGAVFSDHVAGASIEAKDLLLCSGKTLAHFVPFGGIDCVSSLGRTESGLRSGFCHMQGSFRAGAQV